MDIEKHLRDMDDVNGIDGEIYICKNHEDEILGNTPSKYDVTIACICTHGTIEGEISLIPFSAKASSLLVVLPNQVVCIEKKSEDFKCYFIIMTKVFIEKITLAENFSAFMSIRTSPCMPISHNGMLSIMNFYQMVKNVLCTDEEGFNKKAIIHHLTIAFFYGLGFYIHKMNKETKSNNETAIRDKFFQLLQVNFMKEHSVEFYAEKMCYSSKYLSVVIKNATGKSPSQWIADYIILEAKTLLKDTTLTAQQISNRLNFPSQTFFGKYFRSRTGLTPISYRKGLKF